MLTKEKYLQIQNTVSEENYTDIQIQAGLKRGNALFIAQLNKKYYDLFSNKICRFVYLEHNAAEGQTKLYPKIKLNTEEEIVLYKNLRNESERHYAEILDIDNATEDSIILGKPLRRGDKVIGVFSHIEDDPDLFLMNIADIATYYILKENRAAQLHFDTDASEEEYYKSMLKAAKDIRIPEYEHLEYLGEISETGGIEIIPIQRV